MILKIKFYSFLIIIFVVLNVGLSSWGLTESSEARYAEISREMVVSGDYVHPRLLEIQHYHKPPLTYWITAAGYKFFGINEFGARFFLQVSLIIQLLFVFKISLLLFKSEKIAFSSAIIYFSFPLVLIATRNLTTDAYLVTLILGSIYSWLVYKKKGKKLFLYVCYFLLGIGFLNKGPVSILPVLVFVATWKFIFKEKWSIKNHHILGIIIFALVSASWFIIVIREMPGLWDYFFLKHTVDRAVSAEVFHREQPFWYFLALAPLVGLPWFVYSFILFIKRNNIRDSGEKKKINMLAWTVTILFLLFSSFSSKLIPYILPVFPLIAIIGAYFLETTSTKIIRSFNTVYLIIITLWTISLIVLSQFDLINLNLSVQLFLVLLAAGSIVYSRKYSTSEKSRLLGLTNFFAVYIIAAFALLGHQNPFLINSTKQLIFGLKERGLADAKNIIIYDQSLSSAPFYLNRPTTSVYYQNNKIRREVQFERDSTYRKYYLDINDLEDSLKFGKMLRYGNNVFILKKNTSLPGELNQYLKKKDSTFAGNFKYYY